MVDARLTVHYGDPCGTPACGHQLKAPVVMPVVRAVTCKDCLQVLSKGLGVNNLMGYTT